MIKKNLEELIKLANDGDNESQFILAEKYYSGLDGLIEDKEEAFYWYYQSAENGNKKSNERIANFLYYGEIVEKDLEKAKEWYENTDISKEKLKELFDDFFLKYNENKEENEEYNKLFTHYFSEINKFDVLTKEEENKLFMDYKNNGKFAFEKLVISNLRFVFSQVLRYVSYNNTYFWDYFQEGVIGLIVSIKKFDIKLGYRLSSYSFYWINQKIKRALKHYPYFIQIPDYIFDKNKNDNIIYKNFISLNLKNDDGDSFEFLSDNENPENIYFKNFEEIRMLNLIDNIEIDLKNKDILKMYYGFYPYLKTHTLEEIGKKYNVTRERIRQKKLKLELRLKNYILSLKNLNKEIKIKKGYFYMKNEFNIYAEQYKEAKIKHEKKDFQAELALLESIEKNCPYSKDNINFFEDIYQDLIVLEKELNHYEKVTNYLEKAINLFKDENAEIFVEELKNIKDSLFKKVNEEIKKADNFYDENEILNAYNLYNEVYEEIIKFNINLSDEILESLYINLGDISKELENKRDSFFYKEALKINPNSEYLKEIFNKKENMGENKMEEKEMTKVIFQILENIRKEDIDIYNNLKIKEFEKIEIKGLVSGIEGMLEIKFGIASLDLIKDIKIIENIKKIYEIKEKILESRHFTDVENFVYSLKN